MTNLESTEIIDEMSRKMDNALSIFQKSLQGIRSGRVTPNFFDPVIVEAYGDRTPLAQVANINIIDARMIMIQVWDINLVKEVEKAISIAGLGVNPSSEGKDIRIVLPQMSEERRNELAKKVRECGENAKISLRNVRREAMDDSKKIQKSSVISEDEQKDLSEEIQKKTDKFIQLIEEKISIKEKEIKQI